MLKERGNRLLKLVDRYFAIPLVFFLGFFRIKKKSIVLRKNSKILFIKTGAVGDAILLSAIALELKNHFPKSQIAFLGTNSNQGIFPLLKGIDQFLVFDFSHPFSSLMKIRRSERYDLLIDFAAWPKINSVLTFFSRAQFKIGFRRKNMFRHYVYDRYIVHKDTVHEMDNYRSLLHLMGLQTEKYLPQLNQNSYKKFKNANQIVNKKIVVFNPFASGQKAHFKQWPVSFWEEIKDFLIQKNYFICITGGKDDAEKTNLFIKSLLEKEEEDENKIISFVGILKWEEAAFLLSRAKLLITVNTGIMHLGATIGINTIALNGPTATTRWGALSKKKNVYNLKSSFWCSPCLSLGFEYACAQGGCMEKIKVENVRKIIETILK